MMWAAVAPRDVSATGTAPSVPVRSGVRRVRGQTDSPPPALPLRYSSICTRSKRPSGNERVTTPSRLESRKGADVDHGMPSPT